MTDAIDDDDWPAGSYVGRLPTGDREGLLRLGIRRARGKGTPLFVEGDLGRHVEVIHEGYVKVTRSALRHGESLLAIRGRGDIVGELAAIGGTPRSANIVTCGRVISSAIPGPVFTHFLAEHPHAANCLVSVVGDRLSWANRRRVDFAADTKTRLVRLLMDLTVIYGISAREGRQVVLSLTQAELASMSGAREATINKLLRDLQQECIVATGRGVITIVDPGRLLELSGLVS